MKSTATVLFALAVVSTFQSIHRVFIAENSNRPEEFENLVGYAVGSFLFPLILLILGLVLHDKSKRVGDGGDDLPPKE